MTKREQSKAKRGEARAALERIIHSNLPGCIVWPFAKDRDGYGHAFYKGRLTRVAIIVLEETTGNRPPDQFARHGPCNNRACVNPKHLCWGTYKENAQDKLRDGTYGFKLTPDKVMEIRLLLDQHYTKTALAIMYGVSVSTISDIGSRRTWANVP